MGAILTAQQHSPILWIFDVTGAGLIVLIFFFGAMSGAYQRAMEYQTGQYLGQLNEMIERMADLEQVNDTSIDRIEQVESDIARRFHDVSSQLAALENVGDARREVFELEMRRSGETAVRKMQDQLDSTADQVEAIGASLQFHRGELRRLRQQMRELQIASPRSAALAGTHLEARDQPAAPCARHDTSATAMPAGSEPVAAAEETAEAPAPTATAPDSSERPHVAATGRNGVNGAAASNGHAPPANGQEEEPAVGLRRARLSVESASASQPSGGEPAVPRAASGRKSRR